MDENKKRQLVPMIEVGVRKQATTNDIRMLAQNDPRQFGEKMNAAILSGDLRWGSFNVFEMYKALAPVRVPVMEKHSILGTRAMDTSAFPVLCGSLTAAAINQVYEKTPTIGQELVEDMDSDKKLDYVSNILDEDSEQDVVDEGHTFPMIGASEEFVSIGHKRNGRRIAITEELIRENDVLTIERMVRSLAETPITWTERQTLRMVCDYHGSNTTAAAAPYVYHPNGAGAALYSATANTPGTRAPSGTRVTNNPFVDGDSLETARARLVTMKDSRGNRIFIPMSECIVLFPDALAVPVMQFINSAYIPGSVNEKNAFGPEGAFKPARALTSPLLDDISTTAWYLGAPKRQFKRKWKTRFKLATLSGESTEAYVHSGIAFEASVKWDMEVGATDYVYFVQNLSSTTYTPS